MRDLSPENAAALEARQLVARDFVWIVVRNRATGAPFSEGYWTDVGDVSAPVIDPETGAEVTRNFHGTGTLISADPIPLVSNLTVQSIEVSFSQIDDRVNELIREYDPRQGRIQIFRGLFSPASRRIVAPAFPRFVGFIDKIRIRTPKEGEVGSVVATCVSHTQEMTRVNPATRSTADQARRLSTDSFFRDVGTAGELEIFWGVGRAR